MTRTILCGVLAGGCLLLGLATALVQAENRDRGMHLNEKMERCRMLEGVTRDTAATILGEDWGPLPADPTLLKNAVLPKRPKPNGAQP